MTALRNVVVGTDFSQTSLRALELALGLARESRARVVLVHVCELGAEDHDDQRLLECERTLCRLVDQQQRQGGNVMGVLRTGRPWQKLDNVAVEVGASLIVIGRQGAGRSPRGELGSVADQLVRSASRPVLLVARELNDESPETNS